MSNPYHISRSLLQCFGVAGSVCARAFTGTGAPKIARRDRGRAAIVVALVPALAAVLLSSFPVAAHAETCPNEQLRSEAHSANLPDCRAYELVTPPFTEAALAPLQEGTIAVGGWAGMSVDGSQVAVSSFGNFGDGNGGGQGLKNTYELTRNPSGWSETDIDIPVSRFPASEIALQEEEEVRHGDGRKSLYASPPIQVTPDFSKFLYQSPANEIQNEYQGSFWIGEAGGALNHLGPARGEFLGASRDLSHVVFRGGEFSHHHEDEGPLEEDQYVPGREVPAVPVGVDPSGSLCSAGYAPPTRHDVLGGESPAGGMSANGSVVFFYIPAGGCSPGEPAVPEIFARITEPALCAVEGLGSPCTVAISEPSKENCAACETSPGALAGAEHIAGASADGSKVFFTTTQPLLDGSGGIYEYDFDAPAGEKVRLVGRDGAVAQISEDGSHVYFTSPDTALSATPNNEGEVPQAGAPNLYVYDTETGTTAFIATVSPGSEEQLAPETPTVTPNGQFLVFATSADITPDDTSSAQQVFEYDAQTGELVRISIGQNGFNDNGNTSCVPNPMSGCLNDAQIPAQQENYPVAVSDNGAYVAFESPDGLTPGALNGYLGEFNIISETGKHSGTYYAENVYEYHDGNVYLISDGQDTAAGSRVDEPRKHGEYGSTVKLEGMSPSGENIFFETADRLVPQALVTQKALYDARIDGGFPAPVSLQPTCSGDACQGPLSPAPVLLSPGSEFQAPGNASLAPPKPIPAAKPKRKTKPTKCKQGLVKNKKGKCVRKRKAKKSAKVRK